MNTSRVPPMRAEVAAAILNTSGKTAAQQLASAKALYVETMARPQREACDRAEELLKSKTTALRLRQMQTARAALERAEADAAAIFEAAIS